MRMQAVQSLPDTQQNLIAFAAAALGSLAWTKIWDTAASSDMLDRKLSRKIGELPK